MNIINNVLYKKLILIIGLIIIFFINFSLLYSMKNNEVNNNKVLNIGEAPWDEVEKIKGFYDNFLVYLSEQLGMEVVLNFTPDYGTLQKDLKSNNIQIAAFPPGAYADALLSISDKMRYIATIKWNGKYYYEGHIFTHKENTVNSIINMKGRSFGFTEFGSSSGYKYPFTILINEGIDPDKYLKVFYLGSHVNVIKGVFNKRIEFGATYDRAYDLFQEQNGDPFKIIRSYSIPFGVFAASNKISDKMFFKIRKALTGLNKKTKLRSGKLVLENNYYLSGFVVKDNSLYDIVIKTIKVINRYKKK